MRSRETGSTTLIGLLIATTIAIATIPLVAEMQNRKMIQDMAAATGHDLSEFGLGLRGFIAAVQSNHALIPAVPMVGADWLKSPACGGLATNPNNGYIPCDFGNYGAWDTLFDANYRTTFTLDVPTNFVEARTTFTPTVAADPRRRGTVADMIVNAAMSDNPVPASGLFSNFMSNVPVNATDMTGRAAIMSDPAHPDFGRVLLITSNAPNSDLWLRTDGTNQMMAALNMGGNDLINAQGIQATGNMTLGGSASIGGDTVIDQSISVGSDALVGQDLFVQRDTSTGRDLAAQRDIISATGDVKAIQGNLMATNGVSGDGRGIVAADDVYAADMRLSNGAAARMSQGVYDMRVVGAYGVVQKPTCPSGLGAPQVFASIQSIVPNGGQEIHGQRVLVNPGSTAWQVIPQVLIAGVGWQTVNNAQIVVSTKCN